MKVWVEVTKDKSKPCYVFRYKPITRGLDFGYENGPYDAMAVFGKNNFIDINEYLRDYTFKLQYIEVSASSFLYEVEL